MKRSANVALVVVAAASVGGVAYSTMPRQNCAQPNAPATDGAKPTCRSSSSSSGYHGHSIFGWGSRASSSNSNGSTTSSHASTGTARGGFGGFASARGG